MWATIWRPWQHVRKRCSKVGDHVSAARSQPYYLDITHPAANKGRVVDFVSAVYLIPSSRIVTLGDIPNDVLMFKKSGMAMPVRKYKRRLTLLRI